MKLQHSRVGVVLTAVWLGVARCAFAQPAVVTNAPAQPTPVAGSAQRPVPAGAATAGVSNPPAATVAATAGGAVGLPERTWVAQPLSLLEAVNVALRHNTTILKSKNDLEASQGVILQTRAVLLPKLQATGNYTATDSGLTEKFPFEGAGGGAGLEINWPSQKWNTGLQLVQSIYEGGRMNSARRSSRLLREQALLQHQAVLNNVVTDVGVAYASVLAAADEIKVRAKSVELLTREWEDMKRRLDAGTVPKFNVLRAEVELANSKPKLSNARNQWRIAKNNLVNLLGLNLSTNVLEDIPMTLTDRLQDTPYEVQLPAAIAQAWARRPELQALRKAELLRQEDIRTARAGAKPSLQLFSGYQGHSSSFSQDLTREVHGWDAGAQMSWNIFDGLATQGRVKQARALHERSQNEIDEAIRAIELEVRTAYSTFLEANEVLATTAKVVEQAEEALRLAKARADAGTSTQLDVLTAETSLTEAGNTRNVALRDYVVARLRLQRAIGQPVVTESTSPVATPAAPAR